jgi:hypothetical protein
VRYTIAMHAGQTSSSAEVEIGASPLDVDITVE